MKTFVISLGGSLVVPNGVDTGFIKDFRELILEFIEKDNRFVLVVGGGRTSRKYQEAAVELGVNDDDELDWIGIKSTVLNASLVKAAFSDAADCHPDIISNPEAEMDFSESILVASGWKPGFSTDLDAVVFAEKVGADKVINMSNVEHVYDKDPAVNEDANPLDGLSWDDYISIIPSDWKPGLHTPFDPIAARRAHEKKIEVAIMGGDLENLRKFLEGEDFEGTVIR